jgi:hypothetical protein
MSFLKGWFGEKKTTFNMWLSLDSSVYHRYHNLIISGKNETTQIDHLIVSQYGLFIVETKNKKGWIFGSEGRSKWTQSIFGNNYSFQNPLRQTYRQKNVLAEFLYLNESLIHTVIFFNGDCTFKTKMPNNVINSGLGKFIKQFNNTIIDSGKLEDALNRLDLHQDHSELSKRDHIQSVRSRRNSDTICPKCGASLVERTARNGPKAGSKFIGCENFPKCRFTKNL